MAMLHPVFPLSNTSPSTISKSQKGYLLDQPVGSVYSLQHFSPIRRLQHPGDSPGKKTQPKQNNNNKKRKKTPKQNKSHTKKKNHQPPHIFYLCVVAFHFCYILLGDSHRDDGKTELLMPPCTWSVEYTYLPHWLFSNAILNLSLQTDSSAPSYFVRLKSSEFLTWPSSILYLQILCRVSCWGTV